MELRCYPGALLGWNPPVRNGSGARAAGTQVWGVEVWLRFWWAFALGGCLGGHGDHESESLDPGLEPLRLQHRIVMALEVVGTGLFIEGACGEQVPDGGKHRVGDRHRGLLRTSASCDAGVLGGEVGPPAPCRHPGGLDHDAPQPPGAVAGPRRASLPRRLMACGCQPRPGAEVSGGAEPGHVDPDLGDDHLGADLPDPGHRGTRATAASKGSNRAAISSLSLAMELSRKSMCS